MIGKVIIGIFLFALAVGAFNWIDQSKNPSREGFPSTPIPSGSTEELVSSPSVTTGVISQMSEEDIIRRFFELISEGKIPDAIAMQSASMVPDEGAKQQWGVTWNSFAKVSVTAISPSVLDPGSGERKTYRVDMEVRMKPGNKTMWSDGGETRWVSIVRDGSLWKIDDIATGP